MAVDKQEYRDYCRDQYNDYPSSKCELGYHYNYQDAGG
jgi:hypothetical protein